MASPAIGPVRSGERLSTIDTLRGFALLGILAMNIPTFGLTESAMYNPHVGGGDDLRNRLVMVAVWLLGEGKMRAIFSMMFGASAILLTSRGEAKGGGLGVADVYYRRTLWLMLFGMIHGYLIWWGDILFPYALLGLALFAFRNMSPRALLITATVQIVLMTAGMVAEGFDMKSTLEKYNKVAAIDLEANTLTKEQQKELNSGLKLIKDADVAEQRKKAQKEYDNYRGNYAKNMEERVKTTWGYHQLPIYFPFLWDMMSMMLVGMAFYKLGILTGERSVSFYVNMAVIGAISGLAINGTTMWFMWQHDFSRVAGPFDSAAYEIGRVPMALCYVALLVLAVKTGTATGLTARLASVGQMAFSNYISHSLICSVIFYGGYGFGLSGKLERWQLYVIVLAIWTFNLIWSPIWLRHFYFGPLEWCWRSLTYWKRQPMRIRPAVVEPETAVIAEPSELPAADRMAAEVVSDDGGSDSAIVATAKAQPDAQPVEEAAQAPQA